MNIRNTNCLFTRMVFSIIVVTILCMPLVSPAQETEKVPPQPDLRKWSIQVYGGSFIARDGMGTTPFTGTTGVRTDWINPTFGAGIEYMVTPSVGANVRYTYSIIENDPDLRPYENTYQSVTAGVSLYVLNLAMLDKGHRWFNPYVSLIAGMGHSSKTGMEGIGDQSQRVGHYGFGLGTRLRLGSAIDLSLDYMYHQFNPGFHIDGYNGINGIRDNDRLAGFTAGLVFNLGTSQRPHARWYSPVPAEQEWRRSMDEVVTEREDQWDQLMRDLDAQTNRLAEMNREMQDKADRSDVENAQRSISVLEAQIAELQNQFGQEMERIDEIHEAAGIAHLKKEVDPGLYVQTYAAWSTSRTQDALEMTRNGLAERGYDVDRLSFFVYQLPNGLYTVQVGNLESLDAANDVLTGALDIFDDSFVRQHRPQ